MSTVTIELLEKILPPNLRTSASQSVADLVNNAFSGDPVVAEEIRNNFISYTHVLKEGKFKVEDYLNAVTYVSFKLMGMSNQDAYIKTFPQRYTTLMANGATPKDISAYVAMYHKGKLVNLVMESCLVPTWVLNQDLFQKALNVQAELMLDDQISPKVRSDAANSLLTHLAKPKEAGPLINVDMRETQGTSELRNLLRDLASKQQSAVASGQVDLKSIAAASVGDVVDVTPVVRSVPQPQPQPVQQPAQQTQPTQQAEAPKKRSGLFS